jgi:hypothetical protein
MLGQIIGDVVDKLRVVLRFSYVAFWHCMDTGTIESMGRTEWAFRSLWGNALVPGPLFEPPLEHFYL